MKNINALACLMLLLGCINANAQKVNEYAYPEMYLQYIPVAAGTLLPSLMEDSGSNLVSRLGVAAAGAIYDTMATQLLKHTVRETRPDGKSHNSFPSGHTSTAFLGAEIVRQELGGWYGAGAYALATSVAVLRVYHNRHWWWDTLAGAAIGIACTDLGYATVKAVRTRCGKTVNICMVPMYDPIAGAGGAGVSLSF